MRRARPALLVSLTLALAAPGFAQEEPQRDASPTPPPAQEEEGTREERRGPPGFEGDEMTRRIVGMLEDELDLDDAQVDKVTVIMEGATKKIFERMGQMWGRGDGGPPDFDAIRSTMEDVRVEISKQIFEVLTPAQQREFEALVDQFDRRTQQWEQSRRLDEDPSRYFDDPPLRKRILLAKAERALFLGPDETQAVMPFVEDVLDKRAALQEGVQVRRRDLKNAVDGGADRAEVEGRLRELKAAEQLQRLELLAAEQKLRELLTLEQEVRFVAMGILD